MWTFIAGGIFILVFLVTRGNIRICAIVGLCAMTVPFLEYPQYIEDFLWLLAGSAFVALLWSRVPL